MPLEFQTGCSLGIPAGFPLRALTNVSPVLGQIVKTTPGVKRGVRPGGESGFVLTRFFCFFFVGTKPWD